MLQRLLLSRLAESFKAAKINMFLGCRESFPYADIEMKLYLERFMV